MDTANKEITATTATDEEKSAAPTPSPKGSVGAREKVTWTPMQRLAIDTRDKTLLISAAAGSGKTATLTQRILESIIKDGISITSMLIVTFTRSAAAQLREKIGKAIREKLTELHGNPTSDKTLCDFLEKQLYALPSAKICTIDSFCADILRANADKVNVSASFRIPDGAECALIGERILNGLFHDIYAGRLDEVATAAELSSLSDCLTDTGKDSSLAEVISKIYDSTTTTVEGVESFLPLVEEYNPEKFTAVERTRLGEYAMLRLREMAEYFADEFGKIERELLSLSKSRDTDEFITMISSYRSLAEMLRDADSYTAARDTMKMLIDGGVPTAKIPPKHPISYPITKKKTKISDPSIPSETTRLSAYFRDCVKDDIFPLFAHAEDEWKIAYAGLYRELTVLMRILRKYEKELRAEKVRRNICEFSDIERYTYECLIKDGMPTEVAIAQAKLFEQVYIDEYQDVNDLQDRIFGAISTPTNRFMVGDIKQSIYRFRGGNPNIFARMKNTYPEHSVAGDSPHAVIFMSDNFRCDRGVVDFTNLIFDRIFGFIGESIGYVKQDRLNCSKYSREPITEPPYMRPEVCLIDNSALNAAHKDDPNWDSRLLAPYVVAEKILELKKHGKRRVALRDPVTNEPIIDPETGKAVFKEVEIKDGDIAILMRKAAGRINNYKRVLDEYHIPNAVAEETKFFLTAEALLALCLLNAIDNPHKDIYLAGLMLSPLYSFTEDELAIIKKKKPDPDEKRQWEPDSCTLYTSLTNYVNEHPDYEKGRRFIQKLEHYRIISQGMPTDALLLRLYNDTGILALAAKNGTKERLLHLYEYARSFEAGSYKGLYNFISYINSILERKNSLDKKEALNEPDAVKIITSHSSKGLEYPIVFYVGTEDELGKTSGEAPRYEYAEAFGIGMHLRSKTGVALVKNPTKRIIRDFEKRRELEEEARILYVGLTRAEEQLYIVTPTSVRGKKLEDFYGDIEFSREHLGKYPIYGAGSMSQIMFMAAGLSEKSPDEFLDTLPSVLSIAKSDDMQTNVDNLAESEEFKTPAEFDTGTVQSENFDFKAPTDSTAGQLHVPDPYTDEQLYEQMQKRFTFVYPRLHLTRLPEKVSVSALYPRLLDGSDEGVTMLDGEALTVGGVTPSIIFKDTDEADGAPSIFFNGSSEADGAPPLGTVDDGEPHAKDGEVIFDGLPFVFETDADGADSIPEESIAEMERRRIDKALHFRGLGIKPSFMSSEELDCATKRGIATHLLFQFCNLKRLKAEGAEKEILHLLKEKYLSDEDASRIKGDRLPEVEAFRKSRLIDEMIDAEARGQLYREFRFNLLFPAELFVSDEALREKYAGEKILVQGVIDCLYIDGDGEYHLIDYKTDRLTAEQLADRSAARFEMCKHHARQLAYYGMAVEQIFGKKPITREVYSLHLGDTLSVITKRYP